MKKITIKQFRCLYNLLGDNDPILELVLISGHDIINIQPGFFLDYPIDRTTIKTLFLEHCGVDTNKWQYFTNKAGLLLLNV